MERTNPDKIYFPGDNLTKGRIVDYYEHIAPYMLRHLENRPVMLHRFPEGIRKFGFYQKDAADLPEWIGKVRVTKQDGHNDMAVVNDEDTLLYLANQGTIAFHTWMSQCNKLHTPDKIVFDLDPPDNKDIGLVKKGAKALKHFLEHELGLKTYLMTSGSKGLHVVTPILEKWDFKVVKQFSREVAERVAASDEQHFTTLIRKKGRQGRLFLDYLRNDYQQTSVCAYSLRAREGAPVATPLLWDELPKIKSAAQYHLKNIFRRLGQTGCCPWENFHENAGDIDLAKRKL